MNNNPKDLEPLDANPDPITGEPGAHPVGTGIGAAGAGIAATAIGVAVGGPVGAVIGAAIGAIGGGLVGKEVAEFIDPTVEDEYWRDNYRTRPYFESNYEYSDYEPAYRLGYESYSSMHDGRLNYDRAEEDLRQEYETKYPNARLKWEQAKHATRDAWNRVERKIPGDIDRDGK
ncbi:MAG: hypothetical protein KME17_19170 [Cyanosarcina radialis HA8281-LM2]|jgi:hypothetical protein|nr:hypothetical protein [Cyanosarcina radialis HA8281-LM2]